MLYECSICEESLEDQPPTYPDPDQGPDSNGIEGETAAENDSEPSITVTPCGHIFHEICLTRWFKDKSVLTCPACREICPPNSLTRVFPATSDLTTEGQRCEKCDKTEEDLEFAAAVVLSYEEVVKQNVVRILVLEGDKEALTETLKDAYKQILKAKSDLALALESNNEKRSEPERIVVSNASTEQEHTSVIESPPSLPKLLFRLLLCVNCTVLCCTVLDVLEGMIP